VIRTLTTLPSIVRCSPRGHQGLRAPQDGLAIDLRVVEPEAFGAALQYFHGSKEHT